MLPRVLLVCLLCAWSVSGDQVVINEAIDQLLASARLALKLKGSNKIPMKDLDKTFKTKIFGMEIPGQFSAHGGYLEDLSTIHRTGDVVTETQGNTLRLTASLGFDLLRVFYSQYNFQTGDVVTETQGNTLRLRASLGFDLLRVFYSQYNFQYLSVQSSGTMEAGMKSSSVTAALAVTRDGDKCSVAVERATVDSLGKIELKLDGPQVLNQLITLLGNWLLDNFHGTIVALANGKISEGLKEAVSKVDLCKSLPH